MRYRKRDENGDYVFGHSQGDFLFEVDAVAQAGTTRLELWLGTWWEDLTDGTPYYQKILGTRGDTKNLQAIMDILQGRILGTKGVTAIKNTVLQWFSDTRQLTYSGTINTEYSERDFTVTI